MKVSVVIPVYNREFELKRAILSVLNQTMQDFEIIVVDDFSTIDLKTIVDSFNDKRISFFKLNKKGNANVCRNYAIKEAKGQYIAMLDSDDEWLPLHLEKKIKYIEETGADGVFGSYLVDDGKKQKYILSRPIRENELMVNYLLSDGAAATPTHFYKSECAKNILWDEKLFRHQDYDYTVRFSEKYKLMASADVTCIVHWRDGEKRTEHFDSLKLFIDKNKKDIKEVYYCKYHRQIYSSISNRKDIDKKIIQHYKIESIRFIHVLSLTDYLSTFGINRSKFFKFYLRLEFSLKVLFK